MAMKVEVSNLPAINFAMQQNRVQFFRSITLKNDGDEAIDNIEVTLAFDPGFALPWSRTIARIEAGGELVVSDLDIQFSTEFFLNITERMIGGYRCKVTKGEELLAETNGQVELLAFDQWAGSMVLPEQLAAFVTPNNPVVPAILKRTSEILQQWKSSPAIEGYKQRDPGRVKLMMGALFAAIKEHSIAYSTLAPSYAELGQRIRLCDALWGDRLGNCLEMTLLYAACLESMGLNPLLILTEGHAFAGCWLIADTFADSVNDDVSLITKRTAAGMNEIMAVECTKMCNGDNSTFDEAVACANSNLAKDDEFSMFVDVRRARAASINPLPTRISTDCGWKVEPEAAKAVDAFKAPAAMTDTDIMVEHNEVLGKQALWERKLLDLTLRNALLNTRLSKSSLQILAPEVNQETEEAFSGQIEDLLSAGKELTILPRPADWDSPLLNASVYQQLGPQHPLHSLLRQELKQNKLRCHLEEPELKAGLTKLYRQSRLSLEENGANTLYLTAGMLKWFEEGSEKPLYAPLLLIPVEIVRKSVATGYVLRSRDEDVLLNITLVEMLRQFYGVEVSLPDTLPGDESGVDVQYVFNAFRRAVLNRTNWNVVDIAMLGTFSFSKFVMWNDVHSHSDKLAQNPIVGSLVNNRLNPQLVEPEVEEGNYEERFAEDKILLPIGADSSQLEAIETALHGTSFILHGPPGTGKSQTITNIIANALYNGKRVLFVAEKMAALQVVQHRLEAIGLAPFCLELHSNKAKKSAVLEQLRRTTEVVRKCSVEEYAIKAAQLAAKRQELAEYEQQIHVKHTAGLSLYDCMSRYAGYDESLPCEPLPVEVIGPMTQTELEDYLSRADSYRSAASIIGNFAQHPLRGIRLQNYTIERQRQLEQSTTDLISAIGKTSAYNTLLQQMLGQTSEQIERNALNSAAALLNCLSCCEALAPELLPIADETQYAQINRALLAGKELSEKRHRVMESYNDSVITLPAAQLLAQWRMAGTQWLLKRLKDQRRIAQQLQMYSRLGTKRPKAEVEADLTALAELAELQKRYDAELQSTPEQVRPWIAASARNWDLAARAVTEAQQLNHALIAYHRDMAAVADTKQNIAVMLQGGIGTFRQLYAEKMTACAALLSSVFEQTTNLFSTLNLSSERQNEMQSLSDLTAGLQSIGGAMGSLHDWCVYINEKGRMVGVGFIGFCDAVERGEVAIADSLTVFGKSLYRAYAEHIISQQPKLNLFHEVAFENIIKQYRQLCAKVEKLTQQEIAARLSANLPAFNKEASQASEVGILQRNIRNNARGVPLRKLFDQISGILPRMCPCMLMSPMSVAQYLEPKNDMFDLVIFDEASQMPTCEAVGAIARGSSLVVVGDPKQMPPTNFFTANSRDDDHADLEDLESILDDCLALSLPSKHLKWHYRSKSESLIAFSNANYYNNELLTFPSPNDLSSKVTLVHVDGTYERGASRQNKAEARAVVQEVKRRLKNPATRGRSIGIVTFNTNQQSVIEDMLTDLFDKNPDLEKIAAEIGEPIFVKNLENVQGDERDVILFSVGFGPDRDGRISLNFGPLNREGGWRRLNVAVSRARYEMKVFSTLRATDIDLNRTSAEGVAGLRAFLLYAEKGRNAQSAVALKGGVTTDGVVSSVAKSLQIRGHQVKTNIGCSGYKVDLGIVDPRNPNQYLLGVVFDGYNYNESRITRDREIVQPSVLNVLGWRIARIWSMSWWLKPDQVISAIETEIDNALSDDSQPSDTSFTADSAPDNELENGENVVPNAVELNETPLVENPYAVPYTESSLQPCTFYVDEVAAGLYDDEIQARLAEVVRSEAPVSQSLLFRKVVSSIGILRTTARLSAVLGRLVGRIDAKPTHVGNEAFYWRSDQQPESYLSYRPDSTRDALEIAPQEVAAAAFYILKEQGALPSDALLKELAREFNYSRLGNNVIAAMERGIANADSRGLITSADGLYSAKL